jgi:hypothetical protein
VVVSELSAFDTTHILVHLMTRPRAGALALADTHRQINYEMCCHAQLLADAARRPTDPLIEAGPDEIASTKAEMGTPEMGWFSLAAYIEEEEQASGGEHKL